MSKTIDNIDKILDERGPPQDYNKKKAQTWKEVRIKSYRATLVTTVVIKARDFADAEWQILNAFEKKKPKVKGMRIENFSVDAMDEL